ncbi:MAG: DUF371 domain-containing protein [Thermofilaceae archaeon]
MIVVERIEASGHPAVKALHKTTFEITRDSFVTPRGDCIIGVSANKAAAHLSSQFKSVITSNDVCVIILLKCDSTVEIVKGYGSPQLSFTSKTSIVVRKSFYIDGRTIAVNSDKAAIHLNRELVRELRLGKPLTVLLAVCQREELTETMKALENIAQNL